MKKLIILSLFTLVLIASMFADADPRTVYQEIALANVPAWTMTDYPTTDPHYLFQATYAGITFGTDSSMPQVSYFNVSNVVDFGGVLIAQFDQAAWPNPWTPGQTLTLNIWYRNNIAVPFDTATNPTSTFSIIVPAGTDPMMSIPSLGLGTDIWTIPSSGGTPPADTFQLTVTSNVAGTIATGGTAVALHPATPWTSPVGTPVADLIGSYSMTAIAGGTWSAPIPVAEGDFMAKALKTKTINFVWTANPPADSYTYKLQVTGPVGYNVGGPGTYTHAMPNQFICGPNATDINDLVGTWAPTTAAGAGFHWEPASVEVLLTNFVVGGKSAINVKAIQGSRSDGAKTAFEKSFTIAFARVADPTTDYTDGVSVVVAPSISVIIAGGNANDILAPIGVPGAYPNPAAIPLYTNTLQLLGAGPWTITFTTTAPVGIWYSFATHSWTIVHNVGGTITFNIPVGGKDIPEVPIALGDETLPVELSYFGATLTAQNFVKLSWISQSETNLLGYRVYRNDTADQATAVSITPVMVPATNTSTTANYSITDSEVAIGNTYYYWLESIDMGSTTFHNPISVLVEGEVPPVLPNATAMSNAYPNPFRMNTATTIDVRVKAGDNGTVTIYNILGQSVKTFKVNEGLNPLNWNGKDSKGNVCGSGIYFYKLSTNAMNQTKKMVIVK